MLKIYRDISRELWSLLRSRDPNERRLRIFAFAWLGSIAFWPVLLITLIVISGCVAEPQWRARQKLRRDRQSEAAQVVEDQKPQREEIRVTIDEVVEQAMEIGRLQEIAAPLQVDIERAEAELAELEKVVAFYNCIEDDVGNVKPGDVMAHIKNNTTAARACRKAIGSLR